MAVAAEVDAHHPLVHGATDAPPSLTTEPQEPDFVDRVYAYMFERSPAFREAVQKGAESPDDLKKGLRAHFGGETMYVRKRSSRQERVEEALRMFNGRNHVEIARALGVGVRTVYNLLKQAG